MSYTRRLIDAVWRAHLRRTGRKLERRVARLEAMLRHPAGKRRQ